MTNNIGKSFEKLVEDTYQKIDGFLVKKGFCEDTGKPGFIWGDEFFESIEAVQNAMKGIYAQISLRIVNPNGEVKKLSSKYTDMYFNGQSPYNKYKEDKE